MKRFLSILLTLTMVIQVAGFSLALAEDPEVEISYTDENGVEHTETLEPGEYYQQDSVDAYNGLPDHGIGASVAADSDIALELTVNGDMELSENAWEIESAVDVGYHTEATINGDVTGGISATNPAENENTVIPQEDGGEVHKSTQTYIPTDASVTVNGNVTSKNDGNGAAIKTEGKAEMTVTGDVKGGIYASGSSTVDIKGNVSSNQENGAAIQVSPETTQYSFEMAFDENGDYIPDSYSSSSAEQDSAATITVGGNLTSKNDGITVSGKSNISIGGDVIAGREYEYEYKEYDEETETWIPTGETETIYTGKGIVAYNSSTVIIAGKLASVDTGIIATSSSFVNVAGDVTSEHGNGIVAEDIDYYWDEESGAIENQATITVGGNVTAFHDGIIAEGKGKVNVTGNVTAGHSYEDEILEYDEETDTWIPTGKTETRYTGNGIETNGNATVTVGGNVTAMGNGIIAYQSAAVDVAGNVTGEHGAGIYARNTYEYDYDADEQIYIENQTSVTVGGSLTSFDNGIEVEGKANVNVGGDITSKNGSGIVANRSSYTVDEESILAECMATVTTGGNISAYDDGIRAEGKATINVAGNVTAGHQYERDITEWDDANEQEVPTGETETAYTGNGVVAYNQVTITVGGNVVSEDTAVYTGNSDQYDSEVTENEDGTTTHVETGKTIPNQAKITIAGDVTSKHGNGIIACGESDITVGGSLNSEYTAIIASGKANVKVDGDVASEGGGIYITIEEPEFKNTYQTDKNGEFIHGSEHFESKIWDEASVTVGGNLTAKMDPAIDMTGNSTVKVWGDVTGGYVEEKPEHEPIEPDEEYEPTARDIAYQAALEDAFSDVNTTKEISRGAVQIRLDEEGNSGQLIIGGTVKANEGNVPVVLSYTVDDEKKLTTVPDLPEMKIYEIAPNGGTYFDVNVTLTKEFEYSYVDEETGETVASKGEAGKYVELSAEDHDAVVEAIARSVQYIIKLDAKNGKINLKNAQYDAENDLYTAHENEDVSVTVSPDEGYTFSGLTATGNYTLTDNGDGTWTLTIHRGGGVTLTATITEKKVESQVWMHPAIGKTVVFGHYDFDGDGTAEGLEWKILNVKNGYAELAMTDGVDAIPDDFDSAFDDTEKAAIKENSIREMSATAAKKAFGDDKTHITMLVKLDALDY